ncbi:MAG: asparagine synthase-related protein [Candidatus Thermoplasmatota archaeon]
MKWAGRSMLYPYEKEAEALASAISASCAGIGECALAFSGGLDSSLLAHHLRDRCRGYVYGVPGAWDLKAAEAAASLLGIPLEVVHLDERVVERALEVIGTAAGTDLSPSEATILIPCTALCMHAKEKTVVTGQGADELFGGYARYLRKEDAAEEMRIDLARAMERGIRFERLAAAALGKSALHPYLDPEVIAAAQLPPDAHIWYGRRKALLRAAARCAGLPNALVEMPKKAAQYGSGATKLVAKMAKNKGTSAAEYVKDALSRGKI